MKTLLEFMNRDRLKKYKANDNLWLPDDYCKFLDKNETFDEICDRTYTDDSTLTDAAINFVKDLVWDLYRQNKTNLKNRLFEFLTKCSKSSSLSYLNKFSDYLLRHYPQYDVDYWTIKDKEQVLDIIKDVIEFDSDAN